MYVSIYVVSIYVCMHICMNTCVCMRQTATAQATASAEEKAELLSKGKGLEEEVRGLQAALEERDLRTSRMATRMTVALSRVHARGVSAVAPYCGMDRMK